MKDLINKFKENFKIRDNDVIHEIKEDEIKYAVLKVLSHYPLINYKKIRDVVFNWYISEFQSISKLIKLDATNFNEVFDSIKFYSKRLASYQSNFLISKYTLDLMLKINDTYNDRRKIDLNVYFAAQIKELIYFNESKCINLEILLAENYIQFKEKNNNYFNQLVRILIYENSELSDKFVEYFLKQGERINFEEISKNGSSNKIFDPKIRQIIEFLNINISIKNKNIYSNFLKINKFLHSENNHISDEFQDIPSYHNTQDKINTICSDIKNLFCENIESNNKHDDVGLFLMVKGRGEKSFYKTYDDGKNGGLTQTHLSDKFLKLFLNSDLIQSKKVDCSLKELKTIIEYKRENNETWVDLYGYNNSKNIVENFPQGFISQKYNRLILFRLGTFNEYNPNEYNNHEQGVLGIYYKSETNDIYNPFFSRYIIWLLKPLSKFIEKHHETDEFRELYDERIRRRVSLLTGHGRDMLINLTGSDQEGIFKSIIETLSVVQNFIRDYEDSKLIGSNSETIITKFLMVIRQPLNIVSNDFKEKLKKLCEKIYKSELVEYRVDVNIDDSNMENIGDFNFPFDLLILICFEILVNAKKNRWIFTDFTVVEGYTKNEVKLRLKKLSRNQIELEIRSSGPEIEKETIESLNSKGKVKDYNEAAGSELLFTILEIFRFGSISFSNNKEDGSSMNFVSVKLVLNSFDS